VRAEYFSLVVHTQWICVSGGSRTEMSFYYISLVTYFCWRENGSINLRKPISMITSTVIIQS